MNVFKSQGVCERKFVNPGDFVNSRGFLKKICEFPGDL